MNGRERVGRMLHGQPVDRRPFAPVLSLYGARLTCQDVHGYFTDPKAYVAGQRAVMDLVAPDVLFAPFALTHEAVAFGGQEHFLPRHAPNLRAPVVQRASELGRVRPPDLAHPRLAFVREAVRRLRGELGPRAMICGICLSPVDLASMVLGLEGWLQTLLFDPEGVRATLALTEPFFVEWANALLDDGADFLALPMAFASPAIVTEHLVREAILPVLRATFPKVRGPLVVHHAGAPLGPFLPLLAELPNVAGFALDSRDSLTEGRRSIGPGRLLFGGVDGPSLAERAPLEVLAQARAVLAEAGGDPLFVLATSSADVPWATPPANLLALREAVEAPSVAAPPRGGVSLVGCSIFRSAVAAMDWPGGPVERRVYLDSALHMDPEDLESVLTSVLEFERAQGRKVLLAYGDCAPGIHECCRPPDCARLGVQNCCEAELGPERYRVLRRDGAFIFLPEWVGRWRELLAKAVGSDEGLMRSIVADQNDRIVFLSREGQAPGLEELEEIRRFFGLPVSVEPVPESALADALRAAYLTLVGRGG